MYKDQWRERDRRLSWNWVTLGIGFATFIGLVVLDATVRPPKGIVEKLLVSWFSIWGLLSAIVWWRVIRWRCPRCGNPFVQWHNVWLLDFLGMKRCVHCGLTRYGRGDESRDQLLVPELRSEARK